MKSNSATNVVGEVGGENPALFSITTVFGKVTTDGGNTAVSQEGVDTFTFAVVSEGCLTSNSIEP